MSDVSLSYNRYHLNCTGSQILTSRGILPVGSKEIVLKALALLAGERHLGPSN